MRIRNGDLLWIARSVFQKKESRRNKIQLFANLEKADYINSF